MIRLAPAAALALAFATPALATDLGAMSDAERQAFRAEVRDWLTANVPVSEPVDHL